jgi:hypothetical protein
MPNIQQPEMRRSGRDPLVQDAAQDKASSTLGSPGGATGPVPPDQQSPYGPQPPRERRPEDPGDSDAILIGGPRDGVLFRSESAAVVTLEIDGLIHRYLRTTAQREVGDSALPVYNYDGVVRP